MASLVSPVLQVLVLISTSLTSGSSHHHRHRRSGQSSSLLLYNVDGADVDNIDDVENVDGDV